MSFNNVGILLYRRHVIFKYLILFSFALRENNLIKTRLGLKLILFSLIDHFCAWVEEVIIPIFKNEKNISKFPHCVAHGKYFLFV